MPEVHEIDRDKRIILCHRRLPRCAVRNVAMWEVFTEQYFGETYVFRTKYEAEDWLASRDRMSSTVRER